MAKRQRDEQPAVAHLLPELWPLVLGHLLDKRGEALADAEWILNWLATHRDAAAKMGNRLSTWLRAVYSTNWRFLVRFAKRRHTKTKPMSSLCQLAAVCGDSEYVQREMVYILMIAQREDELIYACGKAYNSEGYCSKGNDISSDALLCSTYFPHNNRMYPLTDACVTRMLPDSEPMVVAEALRGLPAVVGYLCRRGLRQPHSREAQRALDWELRGEKARSAEAFPFTTLAYVLVKGEPLYSPHSARMKALRELLHHHGAGCLNDAQRRTGLVLWSKSAARTRAIWHRVDTINGVPPIDQRNMSSDSDTSSSSSSSTEEVVRRRRRRRRITRLNCGAADDDDSYSSSLLDDSDFSTSSSFDDDDGSKHDASSQSGNDTFDDTAAYFNGAPHSAVYDESDSSGE